MRGGDAHDAGGHARVGDGGQDRLAAALPDPDLRALRHAEPGERSARSAAPAAASRRRSAAATARGAPAGRRNGSGRRRRAPSATAPLVGFAMGDAACRWRAWPRSRRRTAATRARPRSSRNRIRAARAANRGRAAPSTPGRVSPSGFTTPLHACARPSQLTKVPAVSVNGLIGSSTSAYCVPCRNGDSTTTNSACSSAPRAATGFAQSNSGSAPSTR